MFETERTVGRERAQYDQDRNTDDLVTFAIVVFLSFISFFDTNCKALWAPTNSLVLKTKSRQQRVKLIRTSIDTRRM